MSRIKRAKPSPALLVAIVALVAALAGTAVGGVVVSKLSGKEKKQVTKIARKQASKLDKKIELTPGPKGDAGANGATDVTRRVSDPTTVAADGSAQATVNCQPGERAVGGGGIAWTGITADFNMTSSTPIIGAAGDVVSEGVPVAWQARYSNLDVDNSNSGNIEFRAYVVCAAP
jgi:hypothetical protein